MTKTSFYIIVPFQQRKINTSPNFTASRSDFQSSLVFFRSAKIGGRPADSGSQQLCCCIHQVNHSN